jgi:hypothetical protein
MDFEGTIPTELIEAWAREFDELCNIRMQVGQEKYGDFTWLSAPTIDMALEELADFVNYTRMTAVKFRLIQMQLAAAAVPDEGFMPSNPVRE